MAKIVYGWVVDWHEVRNNAPADAGPDVAIDLFFSSPEKFKELWSGGSEEVLFPCYVGDDFDNLDYIPDNY